MNADGTNPRAGQLPEPGDLIDVEALLAAYHDRRPDMSDPAQRVSFGTSGHRGSSLAGTFTDAHVAALRESTGPCSWVGTRTLCQRRRSGRSSRSWPPTRSGW
jgi:hypothetical protein